MWEKRLWGSWSKDRKTRHFYIVNFKISDRIYEGFREYLKERFLTGEEVPDVLCRVIEKSKKVSRRYFCSRWLYRVYSHTKQIDSGIDVVGRTGLCDGYDGCEGAAVKWKVPAVSMSGR